MSTPQHCRTRSRRHRPRRPMTAVWCLAALCTVAAACSGASEPAATYAIASSAGSTESEPAGPDGADSVFSAADAETVAEALAIAGWPLGVVADAQAFAEGWPAEGGSSEDLARILPSPPGMRVVAFGSLDGDGRSDPTLVAGATVVAVPGRSWHDWWDTATGLDLATGLDFGADPLPGNFVPVVGLPLGAQLRVDALRALRFPGVLVATTGADGTAQLAPRPGVRYHLCVLSPGAEGLIAGCEYDFHPDSYYTASPPDGLMSNAGYDTVMVYFSFGRAYLGAARESEDDYRYFWFQRLAEAVFGPELDAPTDAAPLPHPTPGTATVDLVSSENLGRSALMALVEDSQVGAWWDAISTGKEGTTVRRAALESSPATLLHLKHDPAVHERFWGSATLQAGTYLICRLHRYAPDTAWDPWLGICVHTEFPADSHSHLSIHSTEFAPYLSTYRIHDPPQ